MKRIWLFAMALLIGGWLLAPAIARSEQPTDPGKAFDISAKLAIEVGMAITRNLKATPEEIDKRTNALAMFIEENIKGADNIIPLLERVARQPNVLEPYIGVVKVAVEPSCVHFALEEIRRDIWIAVASWSGCRQSCVSNCSVWCEGTPGTPCPPGYPIPPAGSACGPATAVPPPGCLSNCKNDCKQVCYEPCDDAFTLDLRRASCHHFVNMCACGIGNPHCTPGPVCP